MGLHLPEMGLEKVPSRNAPLRYPKMHFEDASSGALRLRRRREDDYCRVQPTSVCRFGAVSSGRCGAVEFRVPVPPLTRMAAERAEHEQARARMPLLPPVLRGFGGRLAHRVLQGVDVLFGHRALRGVDVLGRRVKRGADVRLCHHGTTVLRALADAAATAPCRCERWRQRCVSRGSGTVHRKTERDGMMGLLNALYCGKVASMIFSGEHIAHSSATALAKANADIAVVLGSCAVMSQHLAQKCMSACAVMSEHLAQGCFDLAAVASQHWAQRSHCVAEFASITYRY